MSRQGAARGGPGCARESQRLSQGSGVPSGCALVAAAHTTDLLPHANLLLADASGGVPHGAISQFEKASLVAKLRAAWRWMPRDGVEHAIAAGLPYTPYAHSHASRRIEAHPAPSLLHPSRLARVP